MCCSLTADAPPPRQVTGSVLMEDPSTVDMEGLKSGTEYPSCITRRAENGNQSKATSMSIFKGKHERT